MLTTLSIRDVVLVDALDLHVRLGVILAAGAVHFADRLCRE